MAAYIEHGKKQAGGASVFTVAALGELWLQYAIGTPEYIPEAFAKLEPAVLDPAVCRGVPSTLVGDQERLF